MAAAWEYTWSASGSAGREKAGRKRRRCRVDLLGGAWVHIWIIEAVGEKGEN
jgi:hypothetical protein